MGSSGGVKTSDDEPAFSLARLLTSELLADDACLLGCLRCGPLGALKSLQVKIIANASPATAPKDRESCSQFNKIDNLFHL